MDVLISDNAHACTSEPHHQHQDYTKCCIGHIKDVINHVLTFTGINITANNSIVKISPHQYLDSQTPNTSTALCFCFYQPVYYSDTNSFPAPIEKKGRWVGFAPNVGYILTFQILMDDTHHIIYHSTVCSALIPHDKNIFLIFSEGEDDHHK